MSQLGRAWGVLAFVLVALAGCKGQDAPPAAAAVPAGPRTAAQEASDQVRYDATLGDGIQFAKPGYPSFIRSVQGMSSYEAFGRWTEGSAVVFQFTEPLPARFTLLIESHRAYGPNAGKPVKVRVGEWQGEATFSGNSKAVELAVSTNARHDAIELTIPYPTSPKTAGESADPRPLGLLLGRVAIKH